MIIDISVSLHCIFLSTRLHQICRLPELKIYPKDLIV